MTPLESSYLSIMYQALAEPFGLLVQTGGNLDTARAKLSAIRKAADDPALAGLRFRRSPFAEGDLVIVNGTGRKGMPEPTAASGEIP
jgi:hypothetical protein